jgi:[NiFe] hydrogenase assembly HybE family chaperone
MKVWPENPAPELSRVFAEIAATRMAGLALCNPALQVEAIAFQQRDDGHWAGVMLTPWAINLLCLPGQEENWPALPACSKHDWQFPSGNYEFTVAEETSLGIYHLCSLFSPALEFESQEAARLTALAAAQALFAAPLVVPEASSERPASSRRAFLGLGH